jgi:hypothetical protein
MIVLDARALTEEKNDDSEYSFYEELEQVCDNFPKYNMKILLKCKCKIGERGYIQTDNWE